MGLMMTTVKSITNVVEYRSRSVIDACEDLLVRAKDGQLDGMIILSLDNAGDHAVAISGNYLQTPFDAFIGIGKLLAALGPVGKSAIGPNMMEGAIETMISSRTAAQG